jgi:hypothetical protein
MKSRPIQWKANPKTTKFWSSFSQEETNRMTKENMALHAHYYSITMKKFNQYPKLNKFFKVT